MKSETVPSSNTTVPAATETVFGSPVVGSTTWGISPSGNSSTSTPGAQVTSLRAAATASATAWLMAASRN
ncbi:MAG TPA: hypothetical protein VM848_04290 [Acidimicrobiia bacterium]|nr:hypothetical protein [Acidimicrobiia bacterium]